MSRSCGCKKRGPAEPTHKPTQTQIKTQTQVKQATSKQAKQNPNQPNPTPKQTQNQNRAQPPNLWPCLHWSCTLLALSPARQQHRPRHRQPGCCWGSSAHPFAHPCARTDIAQSAPGSTARHKEPRSCSQANPGSSARPHNLVPQPGAAGEGEAGPGPKNVPVLPGTEGKSQELAENPPAPCGSSGTDRPR